jgi:peptide/nickel transport system permease protein
MRALKGTLIGVGILVLIVLLGPVLSPAGSAQISLGQALQGPQLTHWFGLDEDGRDLLYLILMGGRLSLLISVVTVAITLSAGVLLGATAAYFGGRWDELFIFVSDVLLAFPSILLVIALAAFQKEMSVWQVIIILSAVGWVSFARLVRGQVLALKEREFIQASRIVGVSFLRLLWRHLVPNLAGPLLVQASFAMAGVIIAESTLSFLGLGVPPDVPSWGRLLDQGVQYLLVAPHLSIFPGLAIMLTIILFHHVGDILRDRLDVKGLKPDV